LRLTVVTRKPRKAIFDRLEQELDALELAMTPEQRVMARNLGATIAKRIENEDG
jgi:hypothetical protein